MTPPTDVALEETREEIRTFFDGFDLRDFALAEPADLIPQDLAYALWSVSPMSVVDGYSAVLVTTPTGTSSFSFGLPLDPAQGDLDPVSVRWPTAAELPWLDEAIVSELLPVFTGDLAWGDVEYWFASAPNRLHAGSVDLTLLGGNVEETEAARTALKLGPAGDLQDELDLGGVGELVPPARSRLGEGRLVEVATNPVSGAGFGDCRTAGGWCGRSRSPRRASRRNCACGARHVRRIGASGRRGSRPGEKVTSQVAGALFETLGGGVLTAGHPAFVLDEPAAAAFGGEPVGTRATHPRRSGTDVGPDCSF